MYSAPVSLFILFIVCGSSVHGDYTSSVGYSPTASGTPPTLYQTTSTTGYAQNPLTVSFTSSFTTGSNIVVMATGGCANKYPCGQSVTLPTGFTKIVQQGYSNIYIAVFYGPSSILTSKSLNITGSTNLLNVVALETNAKGFDITATPLGHPSNATRELRITAASPQSAQTVVIAESNLNGAIGTSSLPSGSLISTYAGVSGYHAGVSLKIPSGSTGSVRVTTASSTYGPTYGSVALYANLYANELTVSGASQAAAFSRLLYPGAAVTPTVIPPPSAGYPQYYRDAVTAVKAGKQPRLTVGMFGGSAPMQYQNIADDSLWMGYSMAVLEFTSYASWANMAATLSFDGYDIYNNIYPPNYLLSVSVNPDGGNYQDIAAGLYDAQILANANATIKNGQGASTVRMGWEWNEGYYPGQAVSSSPDMFIAAARRTIWLWRSLPNAQFVFCFEPLLVGTGAQVDANMFLWGTDAIDVIGGDDYPTTYLVGNGVYTSASPSAVAAIEKVEINATTSSRNWVKAYATTNKVPIIYGEVGVGVRNDGHGIGDTAKFLSDFADDVFSSPVMAFYYWNNGGGGTDSRISPLGYYGPSIYPNLAQVLRTRFPAQPDPTVANGRAPRAPKVTVRPTVGHLTVNSSKSDSTDTVLMQIIQTCASGTNNWVSWNALSPLVAYTDNSLNGNYLANPLPGAPANKSYLVDVRVLLANTLGLSPWTQYTVNLTSATVISGPVSYPSNYGYNYDGTCGVKNDPYQMPISGSLGATTPSKTAEVIQDNAANFAASTNNPSVTLNKALTVGSYVVISAFSNSTTTSLTGPAGFTNIVSKVLRQTSAQVWLWFGPSSALKSTTVTLTGTAFRSLIYVRETTGSYIEYYGGGLPYGETVNSVIPILSASQGGGDRFVLVGWDNAAPPSNTTLGKIAYSMQETTSHSSAVISGIPASAFGKFNLTVGSSGTPIGQAFVGVNIYTAQPPNVVLHECAPTVTTTTSSTVSSTSAVTSSKSTASTSTTSSHSVTSSTTKSASTTTTSSHSVTSSTSSSSHSVTSSTSSSSHGASVTPATVHSGASLLTALSSLVAAALIPFVN